MPTHVILLHLKDMPNIDVAKLVGAASAPVALIIASSIFLSNLRAKYALLSGAFREVSHELREKEDKDSLRGKSVNEQVKLYSGRLQILSARPYAWVSRFCALLPLCC